MTSFLLTGCASGIGRHLAGVLLGRGDCVLATDVDLPALTKHAEAEGWARPRAEIAKLDVREPEDWNRVFRSCGPIDVVMNIAGYLHSGWVHEANAEEVHRHLDINTKGVIFGTQAAARHMLPRGHGHIINVASMAALAPIHGMSLYSAAKYAVRGFSLAAAQELRPKGVYVTVVCPDSVATPLLDRQRNRDEAAMMFSCRRFLTVQDIARGILGRVLRSKPVEWVIPASRGWLARFADVFPESIFWVAPSFRRRGQARQNSLRSSGTAADPPSSAGC
ncbi:MAG: SDR family oxidoreductase [Planctomycetes bacterium]|nr:SDR family oxidoreductase [Planctomycetota bacterium]